MTTEDDMGANVDSISTTNNNDYDGEICPEQQVLKERQERNILWEAGWKLPKSWSQSQGQPRQKKPHVRTTTASSSIQKRGRPYNRRSDGDRLIRVSKPVADWLEMHKRLGESIDDVISRLQKLVEIEAKLEWDYTWKIREQEDLIAKLRSEKAQDLEDIRMLEGITKKQASILKKDSRLKSAIIDYEEWNSRRRVSVGLTLRMHLPSPTPYPNSITPTLPPTPSPTPTPPPTPVPY